ncbi:MAG: ECF transporter S component [Clostridia bacterium]|nr:ECF transporter S component [Clostridia bacterium]
MITIASRRARQLLTVLIPSILIPLVVLAGALLRSRHYGLVSLIVVVLALMLFISGFERAQTGTRRLVLVCVLTVLAVAGRLVPLLKPVAAVTMLAGMYLGGQAGFLTGACAALLSNLFFGQGPWTPFQMFAWGLIGLLAGLAAGPLKRHRWLLLLSGAAAGLLFSAVMDVWTVLWLGEADPAVYGAALITALPFTALYAAGNVLFLLLLAKPIGRKLERVCLLYDI